jgi:hypothetical protein
MTMLTEAPDTEAANQIIRDGLAQPGDIIMSGGGKLVRVDRLAQGGVNYYATDEDGKSWKVRVLLAKAAPAGAVFSAPEGDEDTPAVLHPGTVVEFHSQRKYLGIKMVVLRNNGGTVSVTKLGGEWGSRYIRGVGFSHLRVVDPE